MPDKRDEVSIPVIAEEVNASTRQVVTGGVRVTKTVVPHEEIIEQELTRNNAEIRRVQVNRRVDGPQKPREVDGTLIVPVVEEMLEIQKVWILKEEIHIGVRETREVHRESVTLGREEARIEKLDETGRVIAEAEPAESPRVSAPEPAADIDTPAPIAAPVTNVSRPSILEPRSRRATSRRTSILGPRKRPEP